MKVVGVTTECTVLALALARDGLPTVVRVRPAFSGGECSYRPEPGELRGIAYAMTAGTTLELVADRLTGDVTARQAALR